MVPIFYNSVTRMSRGLEGRSRKLFEAYLSALASLSEVGVYPIHWDDFTSILPNPKEDFPVHLRTQRLSGLREDGSRTGAYLSFITRVTLGREEHQP